MNVSVLRIQRSKELDLKGGIEKHTEKRFMVILRMANPFIGVIQYVKRWVFRPLMRN
jgi:hypothetical protein